MRERFPTCVVLLLGAPGVGKRTVGARLADLLGGVLVDNQLINIPILTLFKWDGRFPLPAGVWDRVAPIRDTVLATIEDLAPATNDYVFTNALEDDAQSAVQYDRLRALAARRGSLFLAVVLTCDPDEQVRRIDTPDRIARLKGSDPEGYRRYTAETALLEPPAAERIRLDTTSTPPADNARLILEELRRRGLQDPEAASDQPTG